MLSRAHVSIAQSESEQVLCDEADYIIHMVIKNIKCSDEMMNKLKYETEIDPSLKLVKEYIVNG